MTSFQVEVIAPDGQSGDLLTVEADSQDAAIVAALAIEGTDGWKAVTVNGAAV